ncbi:MAG: hydroxymethylpyrimidine/phosphomethylpyrimidine kinase [Pseudomonadota bacterium]
MFPPLEPVVLCMGGHDPGGGAGVGADIEAVSAQGLHAVTLVTCLTVQDSHNVRRILPQPPRHLREQANCLLADCRVGAIKLGLMGCTATARTVAAILDEFPEIPLVVDPILAAGGGTDLTDEGLIETFREQLIPRAWVSTPNGPEARRLTLDGSATALLALGGRAVLLTGGHEGGSQVVNRLYYQEKTLVREWAWPRLPGEYHGSGCTLAAALAARLALGDSLEIAAERAQAYTWQTLQTARRTGYGQLTPRRTRIYLPPPGGGG